MATIVKQKETNTNTSRMMIMSPRNNVIDFSKYYTFELKIKLNGSWETIPEINFMQYSLGNVIKIDISDLMEFSNINYYTFYLKENQNIEESIMGDIDIDSRTVTFTLNNEYSTSNVGKKTYLLAIVEDSFDQGNIDAQTEKFVSDEFTVNIIKSLWSNNLNLELLPEFNKNALFKPSIGLQYDNNTFIYNDNKVMLRNGIANTDLSSNKDINDKSTFISRISASQAHELIESGFIGGGMLPKLQNCIDAVKEGVAGVHILDGRVQHSLLLEFFTDKGIGTAIYDENK